MCISFSVNMSSILKKIDGADDADYALMVGADDVGGVDVGGVNMEFMRFVVADDDDGIEISTTMMMSMMVPITSATFV